jgi:hypothetical protein
VDIASEKYYLAVIHFISIAKVKANTNIVNSFLKLVHTKQRSWLQKKRVLIFIQGHYPSLSIRQRLSR